MPIIGGGILPWIAGGVSRGFAGRATLVTQVDDATLILDHGPSVDPITLITSVVGEVTVDRGLNGDTATLVTTLSGDLFNLVPLSATSTLVTTVAGDATVDTGVTTMQQAINDITTGTLIANWPCNDASGDLTETVSSYDLTVSDTGSTSVVYEDTSAPTGDPAFIFGEQGGDATYTGTELDLPNLNSGAYSLFGIFRTGIGLLSARHGGWMNSDGSSSDYQGLRLRSAGDFQVQSNAGINVVGPNLSDATWFSCLFVSEGDGTGKLYINGTAYDLPSNIRTTAIGASSELGFHTSAVFGTDDDEAFGMQYVAVWDDALTASDATDLHNATGL